MIIKDIYMPIITNPIKETPSISKPEGNIKNGKNNSVDFELIDPRYKLSDVIANNSTLSEIKSLISLKQNFDHVFNIMGFSETHKYSNKFIINFYGAPGTGKTITAHAIANQLNKQILEVDYSAIESKYVGDTPKNLKNIFDFAKDKNCLIFFDEADAILSRRVTNMQSATDTSVNQTRSVFLNILNNFEGDIIFATNFISNYDPAFIRRISKHIFFELPNSETRIILFKKYIPKKFHENLDFNEFSELSDQLSAADIEKVCLMSGFQSAHEKKSIIETSEIKNQIVNVKRSKTANQQSTEKIKTRILNHSPFELGTPSTIEENI